MTETTRKRSKRAESPQSLSPAEERRAVEEYLADLDNVRVHQRRPNVIQRELRSVEASLGGATPVKRVQLIQRRLDLEAELAQPDEREARKGREQRFIQVVASYSSRHNISYQAWREAGVAAKVLRKAGMNRNTR